MPSTIAPSATTTSVSSSGPDESCASSSDSRPEKPETCISPTIRPIAVTITMIEADMRPASTKGAKDPPPANGTPLNKTSAQMIATTNP